MSADHTSKEENIRDAQELIAQELDECYGAGGPSLAVALAISQLIRAHQQPDESGEKL